MLILTFHRNLVSHQCQDPTRLKIAHFEIQQHELAVIGSGAEMTWAKCVWEEKFLGPTPLNKTIVTGVVHWTILSLAIQGENSHPRQVVNPLFNSMLVGQPTQILIFMVYTSSS